MQNQDFIDQILTSLKVIGMIKEGQKVKVRNGLLDLEPVSTGIRVAISRWIHHDNRHTTLMYIKNVVSNAMEIYSIQNNQNEKIKDALINCNSGLSALAVTYGEDASTNATLQVMQERIKSEINNRCESINNNGSDNGRPKKRPNECMHA
jgi:hypothetical protein